MAENESQEPRTLRVRHGGSKDPDQDKYDEWMVCCIIPVACLRVPSRD